MTSFWVKKLRLIKNLIRKGADFAKEKQLIYAITSTDQLFYLLYIHMIFFFLSQSHFLFANNPHQFSVNYAL